MGKDSRIKGKELPYTLIFLSLCVIILFLLILNISTGSVSFSPAQIVDAVLFKRGSEDAVRIICDIRAPRAVAAMILGGALALSGYLLQSYFYNPIAGPFVLGISSGAKLMVALVLVFSSMRMWKLSSTLMIGAAFLGGVLSMLFVIVVASGVRDMSLVLVCGVMTGYICSGITDIIVTFANDSDIVNLHNWNKGSFSGITWSNVSAMSLPVIISFVAVILMSKGLSAYRLGENYARNMGVDVKRLKILIIIFSGLLSGCVVAFSGPISFLGIAAPQAVKRIFKTSRPLIMIPASFLSGSVFCLLCDLIARRIIAPSELAIGTVTAVLGAPFVIYIMVRKRRDKGDV